MTFCLGLMPSVTLLIHLSSTPSLTVKFSLTLFGLMLPGMTAANVDKFLGKGYLLRSDVEFAKLAAMGLTVMYAD